MKKKLRDAWISNMLSGRFAQGQGSLNSRYGHQKSKFCCLGVLCETMIELGMEVERSDRQGGLLGYASPGDHFGNVDDNTGMPTKSILWIAGLDKSVAEHLAVKNDNGEPFEDIAKYIKKSKL